MAEFFSHFNEWTVMMLIIWAIGAVFCVAIYILSKKFKDEYKNRDYWNSSWMSIFW
ncbi:MAG: hypothetical protein IJ523_00420 [Succinivibrionaceae bacterium]|nr:hypothetical protein [Succinivibrionaceae bacterium]